MTQDYETFMEENVFPIIALAGESKSKHNTPTKSKTTITIVQKTRPNPFKNFI